MQPEGVTLVLDERKAHVVLMGVPIEDNYQKYLDFFKKINVKHFFIATEYDKKLDFFEQNGITMHKIEWEDGNYPSQDIINTFLDVFWSDKRSQNEYIAVACKRGYGRAPTLAAISLIERGMKPVNALQYLRGKNPRFITERQRTFLLSYEPSHQEGGCANGCSIC